MKVYSWNVCLFNRRIDEMAEYIHGLDFDVLCLQEVPPALLERLQAMPFHLTSTVEVVRIEKGKRALVYMTILSKQPILNEGTIGFEEPAYSLRTRIFFWFSFLGWTPALERSAPYADVSLNDTVVRVVSVHLPTIWGAANRRKEFIETMEHMATHRPVIVAGDFNIIESGAFKLLNWILGGPFKEALPWFPERGLIEETFNRYAVTNPLRGKITHPFSRSQLDHIVVSKELSTSDAIVHKKDAHGSDHLPISVVVTQGLPLQRGVGQDSAR